MNPADLDMESTDEVQVEVVNPDAVSISTEDEAMIIDFTGEVTESIAGPDHDANLAEFMEEADLGALASELVDDFTADRQSRKDWARSYVKGLDLLEMKIENARSPAGRCWRVPPGPNRSSWAFQAQAMGDFPHRSCAYQDHGQEGSGKERAGRAR